MLVELEQWEDAFVHFQTLYDAAVEFEKNDENCRFHRTLVLDKNKIVRWLEKVRPHVPELAKLTDDQATDRVSSGAPSPVAVPPEEGCMPKPSSGLNRKNHWTHERRSWAEMPISAGFDL